MDFPALIKGKGCKRGMLKIKQFRYSSDNLAYVVSGGKTAVAIDAGAVDAIIRYVESSGLDLKYVTNTHGHYDHVAGNDDMVKRTGAALLDHLALAEKNFLEIDGQRMKVYRTPGHTADSVVFDTGSALVTGDTLFNGTVGNCFSGDLDSFFSSVKTLAGFPGETVVYAGHDYLRESVAFARTIEKDNPHLDDFLAGYNPAHVFSTIADEMKVNPYLRFNDEKMIEIMKKRGLPVETEIKRWYSLMELY